MEDMFVDGNLFRVNITIWLVSLDIYKRGNEICTFLRTELVKVVLWTMNRPPFVGRLQSPNLDDSRGSLKISQ